MPECRARRCSAARRPRRCRSVAVPLALVACLVTLGATPAAADPPGPSARDVAKSKEEVRERARDVGRIEARLARADGQLNDLRAEVEKLIERYHGERVELREARDANRAAERRLVEATRSVETTRQEIAGLAAEQYRTNGGLAELSGMVAGKGGVRGFVDRMSTVHALSEERKAALDRMRSAEIVADVLRRQAHDAVVAQREATMRVAESKKAAEAAAEEQLAAIDAIEKKKEKLEAALADAREDSSKLVRAREAALARARAEAARRSAAKATAGLSYGGGGAAAGSGEIAVRAALRWLGTPYSWGGGTPSGPSYGIAHGANIHGFDCSGLTMYAWARAGVYIDHFTGTQWTSGPHVPLNRLRKGDLVFFGRITSNPGDIHHVGLYIGGGRMIEAPYTGAVVRISSIWRPDLVGATRPSG